MIAKLLNLWHITGATVILKANLDKSREEIHEKLDYPADFWHNISRNMMDDFVNLFADGLDLLKDDKPRKIFFAQSAAATGALKTFLGANDQIFARGSRDEIIFFNIVFNAFNNLSMEIGSNLDLLPISIKEAAILEISLNASNRINLERK